MKHAYSTAMAAAMALAFGMAASAASESPPRNLDCKLHFSLTGWSAIYKHAEGAGTVTCEDGVAVPVTISAKGAGLTVGKTHIENGTGEFTDVRRIDDVFGNYAQAEAHAGLVKSGNAGVLTKGDVSLALAGSGEGVDLGVDVSKFTISKRR